MSSLVRALAVIVPCACLVGSCATPEPELHEIDALGYGRPGAKADGVDNGPSSPGPQVVFVNFDGGRVDNCAYPCSRAAARRSWAIEAGFGHSDFMNFAPYTDLAGQQTIMTTLGTLYAPYRVTFTTQPPADEPFTMVIVSPTIAPHHGMAPLDCENQNQNDIAFVYQIDQVSPDLIARFAAHELGHSFGLAHVSENTEIMNWASRGRSFGTGTYDPGHPSDRCFTGNIQEAAALLEAALGLW
jgi:hypothetical protein